MKTKPPPHSGGFAIEQLSPLGLDNFFVRILRTNVKRRTAFVRWYRRAFATFRHEYHGTGFVRIHR